MSDFFDVLDDQVLRYNPEKITIPASSFSEIIGSCSWVEFLSVTTDNLEISFNGNNYFPLAAGLILKTPKGKGYRRLFIRNPGAVANTVTVSKGLGDFDDNRLVLSSSSKILTEPIPPLVTPFQASALQPVGGPAFSNNQLITTAGANTNGLIIDYASVCCRHDPTAFARLDIGGNILLFAIDGQNIVLPQPVYVPPAVSAGIIGLGGFVVQVRFRRL